jgi:hypothetical protein
MRNYEGMNKLAYIALLLALISSASAASWSSTVTTNTSSWSIYRQSENLSFDYSQSVRGTISPVDYHGRTLSPYSSGYQEVDVNDIQLRERVSAFEGDYNSEEKTSLRSDTNNSVSLDLQKPAGSPVYTIDYFEQWPVILKSSKTIKYSGKEINEREFVGNNRDFVGANSLYNHEFSKELNLKMNLERMNATILATDEAIDHFAVKATRETRYRLQTHGTGIADFKWRQVGADDEILNAGDEQFVGVYDIAKNISMKSRFDTIQKEDDWLPCCSGGFASMNPLDQLPFKSANGVFDCSCFVVPTKAQFQR